MCLYYFGLPEMLKTVISITKNRDVGHFAEDRGSQKMSLDKAER